MIEMLLTILTFVSMKVTSTTCKMVSFNRDKILIAGTTVYFLITSLQRVPLFLANRICKSNKYTEAKPKKEPIEQNFHDCVGNGVFLCQIDAN